MQIPLKLSHGEKIIIYFLILINNCNELIHNHIDNHTLDTLDHYILIMFSNLTSITIPSNYINERVIFPLLSLIASFTYFYLICSIKNNIYNFNMCKSHTLILKKVNKFDIHMRK